MNLSPAGLAFVRWVMLLVAIGAFVAAAYAGAHAIRLLIYGESVPGHVLRLTAREKSQATRYTAVIAYPMDRTPASFNYRWTQWGSFCNWLCYQEGEALKVRYLRGEPESARVDSLLELLFFPAFFVVLGLGFLRVWWQFGRPRPES